MRCSQDLQWHSEWGGHTAADGSCLPAVTWPPNDEFSKIGHRSASHETEKPSDLRGTIELVTQSPRLQ